jgi:hypothetical protein
MRTRMSGDVGEGRLGRPPIPILFKKPALWTSFEIGVIMSSVREPFEDHERPIGEQN